MFCHSVFSICSKQTLGLFVQTFNTFWELVPCKSIWVHLSRLPTDHLSTTWSTNCFSPPPLENAKQYGNHKDFCLKCSFYFECWTFIFKTNSFIKRILQNSKTLTCLFNLNLWSHSISIISKLLVCKFFCSLMFWKWRYNSSDIQY